MRQIPHWETLSQPHYQADYTLSPAEGSAKVSALTIQNAKALANKFMQTLVAPDAESESIETLTQTFLAQLAKSLQENENHHFGLVARYLDSSGKEQSLRLTLGDVGILMKDKDGMYEQQPARKRKGENFPFLYNNPTFEIKDQLYTLCTEEVSPETTRVLYTQVDPSFCETKSEDESGATPHRLKLKDHDKAPEKLLEALQQQHSDKGLNPCSFRCLDHTKKLQQTAEAKMGAPFAKYTEQIAGSKGWTKTKNAVAVTSTVVGLAGVTFAIMAAASAPVIAKVAAAGAALAFMVTHWPIVLAVGIGLTGFGLGYLFRDKLFGCGVSNNLANKGDGQESMPLLDGGKAKLA